MNLILDKEQLRLLSNLIFKLNETLRKSKFKFHIFTLLKIYKMQFQDDLNFLKSKSWKSFKANIMEFKKRILNFTQLRIKRPFWRFKLTHHMKTWILVLDSTFNSNQNHFIFLTIQKSYLILSLYWNSIQTTRMKIFMFESLCIYFLYFRHH